MPNTKYTVRWNPDSRWNYRHWTVTKYSDGCLSSISSTFLSEAIAYPLKMKTDYPQNVEVLLPSLECKEQARRYYGRILEEMFNVTEGKFIGC